jgi:cytochrome P450
MIEALEGECVSTATDSGRSVEFDPFSDVFFDDPYETYAALRDAAPVYFSEKYGFYALSRHADVVAAHQDTQRFSSSYGVTVDMLMEKRRVDMNMMIIMDQPGHTQLRRLVNQAFSRRTIEGLEPLVTGTVRGFLDALDGRNDFDIVGDFAALFPVEVISAMLGVPEPDRQQIRHWVDTMLFREEGNAQTTDVGITASLELAGYFLELTKAKRKAPDNLIVSKLIEVEVKDAEGTEHRLSDSDVATFALLIAGAGSETVTKLIGNGTALFDRHPDQWQKVLDDEALVPEAVEEVLRFNPPSQYQGRFATEAVELEGGTIPANSPTLLLTGSATRDPRAFDRADEFDITRGRQTSLAFGYGIHTCLGAWLARLESRVAFEEMRRRWPHFEVDFANAARVNMSNVAGYSSLPIRVG